MSESAQTNFPVMRRVIKFTVWNIKVEKLKKEEEKKEAARKVILALSIEPATPKFT